MRGQLLLATLFLPMLARATRPGVSNIGFHPRPGQAPRTKNGVMLAM